MKTARMTVLSAVLLAAPAPMLMVGCQSGPALGEGERASQGLINAAGLIRGGEEQVTATLAAMDRLREMSGSLPELFDDFTSNMDALEKTASDIKSKNDNMRREAERYLAKWDADLQAMANEDIRKQAAKRRENVVDALDKIAERYDSMSASYGKLIGDLRDIRTALEADLTSDGVKALSSAMKKASKQGSDLLNVASKAADAFEALGVKMASSGGS
ncbi:MAG: DUF2959 family protein [Planctomycetota bacterium]